MLADADVRWGFVRQAMPQPDSRSWGREYTSMSSPLLGLQAIDYRIGPKRKGELNLSPQLVRLTRREREVAALMRQDLSNKELATRLRIEVATVKIHVHHVLDKLQVHRRADAARLLGQVTRSSS
jgi:DNA-binding NarL/FixJ family response regulator